MENDYTNNVDNINDNTDNDISVATETTVTEYDDLYLEDRYIYNPQGGNQSSCPYRVRRGGSFNESPYMQTVLYRKQTASTSSAHFSTGFRLCRSIVNIL